MIALADSFGIRTLRERKRIVDGFVLAAPILLLLASSLSWFLLGTELDLASLARSTFILSAAYLLVVMLIDAAGPRRLVGAALHVSPLVGIVVTGVLWHLAGGIAEPALLPLFALPVLAAAFSGRGAAVWIAALFAIATVAVTAVVESPSLAWTFSRWGAPLESVASTGFESLEAAAIPSSRVLTTLTAFAASILAVAAFGHVTRGKLTRDSIRLALAESSGEGGIWRAAVEAQPVALAIVTPESGTVVAASERFIEAMVVRRADIPGIEIFQVLSFARLSEVEGLLESGGRIDQVAYRVGPEDRLAAIEVRPFTHGGESYRAVVIVDEKGEA